MFKKEKEPVKANQEVQSAETKLPDAKGETKAVQPAAKAKPQGLSQREAVYLAVMGCFERSNIKFTGGKAADHLNPEMRKQITDAICADFKAGKVSLRESPSNKEKLGDDKQLRVYVTGLINNWLRRDKRLNGAGVQ